VAEKNQPTFATVDDFTPDRFTATQWEPPEHKAEFARRFICFVESDFDWRQFTDEFYRRLSMTFGHIAHYDRSGFYDTFFTSTQDKIRFLRQTAGHTCVGDPAYTYSDVERALQAWINQNAILQQYERAAQEQTPKRNPTSAEHHAPEPETVETEAKPDGFLVSHKPQDVPYDLAYNAHRGTSFDPDKRAKQDQQHYLDHVQGVHAKLASLADTPEKQSLLTQEMKRYRQRWLEKYKEFLHAESRVVSHMISGSSKFPGARMEKLRGWADKRLAELLDFEKRAFAAMERTVAPERGPIKSADAEAVQKLEAKLAKLEETQALYRKVNKAHAQFLKDPASLDRSDLSAQLKETIRNYKPRYSWEAHPIAPYQLQNNNAEIRRTRGRIAQVSKMKASPHAETLYSDGIRVVENPDLGRIQVFFPSKPDRDTITLMKGSGFHWSRNQGAWQRHLNDAGRIAVKSLMKHVGNEKVEAAPEPTAEKAAAERTQGPPALAQDKGYFRVALRAKEQTTTPPEPQPTPEDLVKVDFLKRGQTPKTEEDEQANDPIRETMAMEPWASSSAADRESVATFLQEIRQLCDKEGVDFDAALRTTLKHQQQNRDEQAMPEREPTDKNGISEGVSAVEREEAKGQEPYFYLRGKDGVDETFVVYGPRAEYLGSFPFWDCAAQAESAARRLVDHLNRCGELTPAQAKSAVENAIATYTREVRPTVAGPIQPLGAGHEENQPHQGQPPDQSEHKDQGGGKDQVVQTNDTATQGPKEYEVRVRELTEVVRVVEASSREGAEELARRGWYDSPYPENHSEINPKVTALTENGQPLPRQTEGREQGKKEPVQGYDRQGLKTETKNEGAKIEHEPVTEEGGSMNEYQQHYERLSELLQGRDHVRIENGPYVPLVVERLEGMNQISMCHYGEQNGDAMRDPEVVFVVTKSPAGTYGARPAYYRNDWIAVEHATVDGLFGDVPVKPQRQKDLDTFASMWFENLRDQGFFERAQELSKRQGQEAEVASGQNEASNTQERGEKMSEKHSEKHGSQKQENGRASREAARQEEQNQEEKMPDQNGDREDGRRKPIRKFEQGVVRGFLWDNGEGREPTLTLARIYKDKEGEWRYTQSLRKRDLEEVQKLVREAEAAIEHGVERKGTREGAQKLMPPVPDQDKERER
jgi:hypothetical protein